MFLGFLVIFIKALTEASVVGLLLALLQWGGIVVLISISAIMLIEALEFIRSAAR